MIPSGFLDLPITVKSEKNTHDNSYWFAQAGLGYFYDNKKNFMFGYGSSQSKKSAEICAYFECAEHYLGSAHSRTDNELKTLIDSHSYMDNSLSGQVLLHDLLIGRRHKDNTKINATGLAIHETFHKALRHSAFEVIERHLSFLWWWKNMEVDEIFIRHNTNTIKDIDFVTKIDEDLWFSSSVFIDLNVPIAAFGSAFKASKNEAILHSRAEVAMLVHSLTKYLSIHETKDLLPSRQSRLLEEYFVSKLFERIELKLHENVLKLPKPSSGDLFNDIIYANLGEYSKYELVRCRSSSLHDASNQAANRQSPYL